jgi:hypothetical protein
MNTITYVRPSGNPLTVNDTPENRAYAAQNGWTEQGAAKPAPAEKPAKSKAK